MASAASLASRAAAWMVCFRCSSFSSMAERTELAIWPMTGRSSAESLPICFNTAVSSPFLPSSLTRSSSRAAGVEASSRAARACSRMLSNCCFMVFPPVKKGHFEYKKTPSIPISGRKEILPRYHPHLPSRRHAFRTQTRPRPITASPGQPYCVFQAAAPGRKPGFLHIRGSHHPALSEMQTSKGQPNRSF